MLTKKETRKAAAKLLTFHSIFILLLFGAIYAINLLTECPEDIYRHLWAAYLALYIVIISLCDYREIRHLISGKETLLEIRERREKKKTETNDTKP